MVLNNAFRGNFALGIIPLRLMEARYRNRLNFIYNASHPKMQGAASKPWKCSARDTPKSSSVNLKSIEREATSRAASIYAVLVAMALLLLLLLLYQALLLGELSLQSL